MTEAELFFGRDIASGGRVSGAEWRRFVDEEITPRFPGGLSVEDAYGQWRGHGSIVREDSKRLTLVFEDGAGESAKLKAIREAYDRRFHQDSVLLLEHQVCGSF